MIYSILKNMRDTTTATTATNVRNNFNIGSSARNHSNGPVLAASAGHVRFRTWTWPQRRCPQKDLAALP